MFHWTDSKIQVHAFYCVLALLLTSLLQRELASHDLKLSINSMLEELAAIRETLIVYPRRQGQRQFPTATCLTRMNPLQHRLFLCSISTAISLHSVRTYTLPPPTLSTAETCEIFCD
jgi:hypothetical protein